MAENKVIIPGGSGFLGRTLAQFFSKNGFRVIVLSRRSAEPNDHYETLTWDGKTLGSWALEFENATAVINLAGRTVNCRYTTKNRAQMIHSRVESTLVIGRAIASCKSPPSVWLNSSTATIYRHRYEAPNTERNGLYGPEKEAKDSYSLEVAHAWEDAFAKAYQNNKLPHTRGIVLRTAMVFGNEPGGVYETLRRLTKLGLGGTMGHGRQYVSWLHADDFCEIIQHLIKDPDATGIYNLTAPHPLTNKEMMKHLRTVLQSPIGLPAPKILLEIGAFLMRTETELIVKSRRVIPERLLKEGYTFLHPEFKNAIASLEQ